ncbi:MAG TPA: indole-3-glycerol phosphate synthase TrpC [Acidobacteriaceae bacterium]
MLEREDFSLHPFGQILNPILDKTRAEVARRREQVSAAELEKRAAQHTPRGFARALREASAKGPAIIAELKKASPSKGLIRPNFDPQSLAIDLERSGAAALSVLTDEPFFQGSLQNLEIASAATKIPCLRKDFIVDEYQIVESLAHRADAILLIAGALSYGFLYYFTIIAHSCKLDVLLEVHTADEAKMAHDIGADAVGVNNRDLNTFEVRLETSIALAAQLPPKAVHVAESGIHTAADIHTLRSAGFHAFLIGTSLMRQPQPGIALEALLHSVDPAPAEILAEHN